MPPDKTFAFVRACPAVTAHAPATDEDIRAMLRIVKVKLPASYKSYLKEFGWLDINGDVVYGLGPDVDKATSVFEAIMCEQIRAKPQMLSYLIPLMADGFGNHDCLDTSKITDGDAPVVLWQHDSPKGIMQKCKVVSPSFVKWLEGKVDEVM